MSREVVLPPVTIEPEELARRLMSPPQPKPPYKVIAHRADQPLKIGDIKIPCYVLENEERVLSVRGTAAAIGVQLGGSARGGEMPDFMHQKWLRRFVDEDLVVRAKSPIPFANPEAPGVVHSYPATVLADLCLAIMEANRKGATTSRQEAIVERASILLGGFATVGIIALVDEATGYQKIREERALATILERYLAKELQPWVRTFPFEFYELLFGLKGQGIPPPNGKMPGWVAHDTLDLVYARLAPGVLSAVMAKAPRLPSGQLKHRLHQWFTPDFGHPRVQEQIRMAMAFMRPEKTWARFIARYNVACRVFHEDTGQLELDLKDASQRDLFH